MKGELWYLRLGRLVVTWTQELTWNKRLFFDVIYKERGRKFVDWRYYG